MIRRHQRLLVIFVLLFCTGKEFCGAYGWILLGLCSSGLRSHDNSCSHRHSNINRSKRNERLSLQKLTCLQQQPSPCPGSESKVSTFPRSTTRRSVLVATVAGVASASASLVFSDRILAHSVSASTPGTSIGVSYAANNEEPAAWQQQLLPSTQERPPILFPDAATLQSRQAQQLSVVEGLVSLRTFRQSTQSTSSSALNEGDSQKILQQQTRQRRPTNNDVLILTMRTMELPETIIAAAKIPIAKIGVGAFPFRFQMSEKNVVPSSRPNNSSDDSNRSPQELWREATTQSNLLVKAVVCDRDIVESWKEQSIEQLQQMCYTSSNQNPIAGSGASMLLRLPPRREDILSTSITHAKTLIRAPVSIVLE